MYLASLAKRREHFWYEYCSRGLSETDKLGPNTLHIVRNDIQASSLWSTGRVHRDENAYTGCIVHSPSLGESRVALDKGSFASLAGYVFICCCSIMFSTRKLPSFNRLCKLLAMFILTYSCCSVWQQSRLQHPRSRRKRKASFGEYSG